ncbi:hypothetical protein Pst134EA_006959 [Puccinia striiformis f. sp. tritici]|uniref:hypothetical protein n=1 Tax=Puccinia striiformis f. sp. tritici TaxID=168172 RepID=UPI0020081E77|nr:hypothetical protein Pst134EA_006959 [Puccinia striiformis f. sp. tritici]KAH9469677.1 hypothetical protein Pst134EA_006959 [Puccinia striiformis f. sp. tritici]
MKVNIVDDWKVPAAQQGIFRTSYVQTPIVSPAPSNTALPNRLAKFVTTFDGVREKRLTNSSELQEREAPIGPPERVESDIMRNFPRVESAHRSAGTSGFKRKNHPSDPPGLSRIQPVWTFFGTVSNEILAYRSFHSIASVFLPSF